MLGVAAYMVKVKTKLTQSSWAGAGTELGNKLNYGQIYQNYEFEHSEFLPNSTLTSNLVGR